MVGLVCKHHYTYRERRKSVHFAANIFQIGGRLRQGLFEYI